jgi:hypothetical protein
MMRDTGFTFPIRNDQDTVTVKISVHWDHDTDPVEVLRVLMNASQEAHTRLEEL